MNIAEVRGVLAIDGIRLNQQENQWHTLTFAKALIGSSKILQAAYSNLPRREMGGERGASSSFTAEVLKTLSFLNQTASNRRGRMADFSAALQGNDSCSPPWTSWSDLLSVNIRWGEEKHQHL